MNLKSRLSRAANNAVEQLETRLLLASGPIVKSPLPDAIPKAPPLKSSTFKAKSRIVNTVNGGTTPGRQPPSINVGSVVNISRAAGNQTEADIAINPPTPDQIFAQSNQTSGSGLFASRSNDGGQTWTTGVIATGADLPAACCDGRVIYDKFGNLWLVYLGPSAVTVARSVNNGASWTLMLNRTTGGSWDNPAIAAGNDGQVWVEVRSGAGPAGFGWKATGLGTIDMTIGGGTGFSPTQQTPNTTTSQNYGDIAVLNDGSVMITYTASGGQAPNLLGIYRDPDGVNGPTGFLGAGGGTASPLKTFPTNIGGFDFIPPQNSRSVDAEPSFAVSPPGSPFPNRVYFCYLDEKTDEGSDTDVKVSYTDDNGLTWSPVVIVNDDNQSIVRCQFLQQIAVDPTTGGVICSWHDSRNDNGVLPNGTNGIANDDAQFYGALSADGGVTWTNFQIDPGWSNAPRAANGIEYGDWTGSDYVAGRFFAVWASNAQGVNGLPNNPDPNRFDLATARVDIQGVGQPGVYGVSFDDSNGNGAKDAGEPGISGVTQYIDLNNNSQLDGGEPNTVSASGGSYSFTGLAPGTYTIRALTPAGLRLSFPASGSYVVNYDGSNAITSRDFGFVNARVAGSVINDANDNGVLDSGEAGLAGITVYLDANNNGQLDGGETSTTSNASGAYSLGGLADGTYVVRAVTPVGRRLTFPGGNGSYTRTIGPGSLVFASDNFGMTDRVRISGTVYRDDNGNGSKDGSEPGLAGARVFQDSNNNGTFDNTGGTFVSNDVPKVINDNTTIQSNLIVSNSGNITGNLTVKLNITHTYDGDLILTLISPQGTNVILCNRRGGTGENFNDTIFDDNAAVSIINGTPPYAGSFRPEQPLSVLNGQNANGTWKLQVQDAASQDVGTLNSWSITFGSTEPNQITPANGTYSFPGLSAGTYNMRQVALANYVFTSPAGGGATLNPVGGDLVTQDFGNFATSYTGSQIYVRLDPTATNTQIWVDQPTSGAPTYTANKNIITSLSFTGTANADSLTIDTINGSPMPTGGVTYNALATGRGVVGDLLTILGNAGTETFVFSAGSASIDGRVITYSGVEAIQFDGKHGGDQLSIAGGPTVEIIGPQHLESMNMDPGTSADVVVGGTNLLVTNALSVANTATLDMFDNDMIVFYRTSSPLAAIVGLIKNARNGGVWNGTGITSTSAAVRAAHDTSLGAISSNDYKSVYGTNASFDGESLSGQNAVLVKYTYYGDADFNGKVDGADYAHVDTTFNQEVTTQSNIGGWFNGDFDYNDKVDGADYALIDAAFNSQLGVL